MTPRFAADTTGRFVLKVWQDDAVAYDLLGGDTHLLEPLALVIVDHLAASTCSYDEIVRHIFTEFDVSADDRMTDMIDAVLAKLQRSGMIFAV